MFCRSILVLTCNSQKSKFNEAHLLLVKIAKYSDIKGLKVCFFLSVPVSAEVKIKLLLISNKFHIARFSSYILLFV